MDGVDAKQEQRLRSSEQVLLGRQLSGFSSLDLLGFCSRFDKIEDLYRQRHRQWLKSCRIALLSTTTVHHLVLMLRAYLYELGIAPEVFVAPFDSIHSELMDPDSSTYAFKPDVLILMPENNGAGTFPSLSAGADEFESWLSSRVEHQRQLWERISQTHPCQIIQCLSPAPATRQLGNLEVSHPRSRRNCLRALETKLIQEHPANVTFFDLDHLATWIGRERWVDEVNHFTSKQLASFDGMQIAARGLAQLVAAQFGRVRKCLVLDLDNTLWGGVIGDDGLDGIVLGNGDAVGEAFIAFQTYAKSLSERGVLLAVCSKNDDAVARKPFRSHPEMRLKEHDIVCFVANWEDKASNLRRIASELNIGVDSLVFFDDNPAERDLVRQFAPEVLVIDVPQDPALYVRSLDASMAFERTELTAEDLQRSQTYQADSQRKELQHASNDYGQYLQSLDMHAVVGAPGPIERPRFAQLINKSNQFNLRTQRYSEAVIEGFMASPGTHSLISVRLKDRFSDYGLISCMIIERRGTDAFIDTWVMSCRVLKRDVENLVFNAAIAAAMKLECQTLTGEFIPTEKNGMVKDLLPSLGFEPIDLDQHASASTPSSFYRLKAPFIARPHYITIEETQTTHVH